MAAIDEIRSARLEKLEKLKKAGVNPYPARVPRDISLLEVNDQFTDLVASQKQISVAGRVTALRGQGAIMFATLDDGTAKFQIVFKKDEMPEAPFLLFSETTDLGDFISVTGSVFVTQRGQNSILAKKWIMASKSLLPLPSEYYGLEDEEELLRKRYLAFVTNPKLSRDF
jgi:lysyl-tRNA synthetase class 2